MRKFQFALENILKYRQSIEDRERELLARAQEKLILEESLAQELDDEKHKHLNSYAEHKFNIKSLRQQESYLTSLDLRIKTQQQQVDHAKKASDTLCVRVVTATSNRKVLESLKEKTLEEYNQLLSRAEQNFLDEVGITAYCHKEISERR